jgi:FKBP-type peptidyl-prolyl cis-trans isomerase SlyD
MNHSQKPIATALMFAMLTSGAIYADASSELSQVISDGAKVTVEYTLALPDKTVVETNVGKEPVSYTQGNHEIIPGLEKALAGLKAGDKKHVTVAAEDAYGPYDEQKKVTVTKEQVPPEVKVGTRLRAQNGMEAKVLSIDGNSVVVDTNHPLAGKSLVFDINVLKVEKQDAKSAP